MADVQESNISESNLFGLPPTKKARAGNVEENMTLDIAEEIPAIVPFSDKNRMQPMCAEQSGTELFSTTKSAGLKYDKGPNTDEVEREGAEREHLVFSEKDFGIEEYISSQKGINGIIKQRYSDFMVREIDQSGRIITLNSITQLPEEAPNLDLKIPCKNEEIECPVSKDDKARIEKLSAKFEIEKASQSDFILLSVDNDKEHRKLVHLFVKENYKNLDTETVQDQNEDKMVKVLLSKSQKGRKSRQQRKDQKRFCHFTLYKENRDTMSVINLIARLLHVKPSIFSYAGTKDKRAITTQKICAYNLDAKRICTLNKLIKNTSVGDFEYRECALKLGDLSGNHFSIVLRNISSDADESSVSALVHSLGQNGFINYFGMQRFGSGSVPTFEIGKQVLSSQWQSVIRLILCPRSGEDDVIFKAKEHWHKTNDGKAAHQIIQRRKCIEEQVLHVLATQGANSYYNAFQSISRNMRLMYIHSYQSFIWNRIVSKRLQTFGIHPIAGDLVVDKDVKTDDSGISLDNMTRCKVKTITEEDIVNGTYTITDVVLPLPGYDITYPANVINDWYCEMLTKDGIDKDNMRHQIKDYSLSGAYRYMIIKPDRVNFKIVEYDDHCIPLLLSDVDLVNGRELQELSSGKYKALILHFSLPPSSYATMLVREITKLDTSTHMNIELNNAS